MLYITFNEPENFNRDIDVYFNNRYQKEWLQDHLVEDIIHDIDNSRLLSNYAVESPILGIIPLTRISGGAKALILMLKTDRVIWGTACGDNCAKWIDKISRIKDITLFFEHPMTFDCPLNGVCIDNNRAIRNSDDFMDCYLASRGFDC
ncbi:MAG: DUF4869 domain-containing protein [Lachnobacterium sp.]|nr:DUF4869 domain-containing protein [Lachnobacterium sp.]